MMSEKSFNGSWISQFGLYRYNSNYLRKRKRESNICFYGITGTASIIIIVVFVFITNTDFDPPKRLIFLSHANKTHHNQLSTASVLMEQIPTNSQYNNEISVTTPLSMRTFSQEHSLHIEDAQLSPQTLQLKSYRKINNEPDLLIPNHNIYPNHRYNVRRQVDEIYQPRPFEYVMRGTPPTAFQVTHKNSSIFPQIPKEYVGNVNSIQDILMQVQGNNNQESNKMQKIKIAGTYKHRKFDDITRMFEPIPRKNRGQNVEQLDLQSHSVNSQKVITDPFYKFKPNSLSDVNLLATNQFRFAPYNIAANKYVPMASPYTQSSMDPGNLYNQIITANKNRLKYLEDNSKKDNIQGKQKPFTLMLDVYPMPDDEQVSSTAPLPVKFKHPFNFNAMRHPSISSINNLQPFFHGANYPQLKGNRYPNLPHYHNDLYFRKFGAKQFNSGFYRPTGAEGNNANNPSQITVHLNLFPKKKQRSDNRNHNLEILNRDAPVVSEKDEATSINVRFEERMAKLSKKVNQTEDYKHSSSEEPTNVAKITNKVDMDVFQNSTESNDRRNVLMIDDSSGDVDSSEEMFSKEFLQFKTIETITELTYDSTTLESTSIENNHLNSIPTVLPIEPREYGQKLDTSFNL